MPKLSVLLFLFLFIFSCCAGFSQPLPSFEKGKLPEDLKINSLSRIKSLKYLYFKMKNDSILVRELQNSKEYIYEIGKLITVNELDPVSDSILRVYEYDLNGKIKSQLRSRKGVLKTYAIYSYNDSLRSSAKNIMKDDSTIFQKWIITYNPQNKPVKIVILDSHGLLSHYYTSKYNKYGDQIEQNFINTPNGTGSFLDSSFTNGKPRFEPWNNDSAKFEYKYGKHRKPVLKIQYHNSKMTGITEYTYKKDTLIVTESGFWPDNPIPTKRTITKTIGNLKIELLEFLTPGKKSDLFKSTYQNGELIKQEGNCSGCGEILYRNEYEYDSSGNWIKKKRYSDNKLISVTERKIIYAN